MLTKSALILLWFPLHDQGNAVPLYASIADFGAVVWQGKANVLFGRIFDIERLPELKMV